MTPARRVISVLYSAARSSSPRGPLYRHASNSATGSADLTRSVSRLRPRWGLLASSVLISLGLSPIYSNILHADASEDSKPVHADRKPSLTSLLRAYFVYSMCSIPILVDASPKMLQILTSIPGIKQITEAFVRVTFFNQFVGGDTIAATLPVLRELRAQNKGVLCAYSVEVDENEANATGKSTGLQQSVHKRIVNEMVRCINVASEFEDELGNGMSGRTTWVAVKMTALLPNAQALINLSSHILRHRPKSDTEVPFPGNPTLSDLDVLYQPSSSASATSLSQDDIESLKELHADLERICARAQEKGVKVVFDAEYSWYQPAIDALTLALMRRFNKLPETSSVGTPTQPLVYGTFQCYLRRTSQQLSLSLLDARKHNYALGVKLVRGAYHPHELAAHQAATASPRRASLSISPDTLPPVWLNKKDTDATYDGCVKMLIAAVEDDVRGTGSGSLIPPSWSWSTLFGRSGNKKQDTKPNVPGVGVLFGTHNWGSCQLILDELVKRGLAVEEGEGENAVVRISEDATARVVVGQLYSMSDDLTDFMVRKTVSKHPFVIKYVPYGALSETMPYLSRRAIENKSVLGEGGAAKERQRAGREIWKRIRG